MFTRLANNFRTLTNNVQLTLTNYSHFNEDDISSLSALPEEQGIFPASDFKVLSRRDTGTHAAEAVAMAIWSNQKSEVIYRETLSLTATLSLYAHSVGNPRYNNIGQRLHRLPELQPDGTLTPDRVSGHSDMYLLTLAQITGRQLRVYEPVDNGNSYREVGVFSGFNPLLPGEDKRDVNLPPVLLLKKPENQVRDLMDLDVFYRDNDYQDKPFFDLLQRNDDFEGSTISGQTGGSNEVVVPIAAEVPKSPSREHLLQLPEAYTHYINTHLAETQVQDDAMRLSLSYEELQRINHRLMQGVIADEAGYSINTDETDKSSKYSVPTKPTLADATPAQILRLLQKVERDFLTYNDAVTSLEKKGKKTSLAKATKRQLEDSIGDNSFTRFGITHRKGRQEMIKALNLINGRIGQELTRRIEHELKHPLSDPAATSYSGNTLTDLDHCLKKSTKLADTLQKPSFKKFDSEQLKADIAVLQTGSSFDLQNLPTSGPASPAKNEALRTDQLSAKTINTVQVGDSYKLNPLNYDLSRAVAASRQLNLANLSTTPEQDAKLPAGYRWHNPSADGNCLFYALEKAFPELGTHENIREVVAKFAKDSDILDENERRQFLEAITQPNEYEGRADSAIQFAAVKYGIHINVIYPDGSEHDEFGQAELASTRSMTLAVNRDHFFLMEPINTSTSLDSHNTARDS